MLAELGLRSERSPDAVAVRAGTSAGWAETTWAELHRDALSVASRAHELSRRGPVVVIVDGTAASVATILGLASAGADVLLIEEKSSYLADQGLAIHHVGARIVVGPASGVDDVPAPLTRLTYGECRAPSGTARLPSGPPAGEILQLTSGSTGEPRVARQPLRNVRHGGRVYQQVFGLTETDVILAAVPLAHSFGLIGGLAASVVSGASLWTLSRFSIRQVLAGLRDGATTLLGTPLVYRLLAPMLRSESGFPALRTAVSSGGPLSLELAAEVGVGLSSTVRQIYGSTEAGLIAYQPDTGEPWPPDAVGVAAPGVRLHIEPDTAVGGQLFVRTPTLFSGYLGAPSPARGDHDSYATGDLARIDDHGRLFLTGRKDTFVNVGGRKVNPRRIERILAEYQGVRDVFVYGMAAPDQEQRLHAAVVLEPGASIEDIVEFCRSRRLAPYEVPHHLHAMDSLPHTGMGKIDQPRVIASAAGDSGITTHHERGSAVPHPGRQAASDRVVVLGLGYVGLTLALALAAAGLPVTGVEVNPRAREALAARRPTFFEPGVAELLRSLPPERFTVTGRLPGTPPSAVIICVGTAVDPDTKRPDLRHLEVAAAQVAGHIAADTLVVVRSTVPVGTCRRLVYPLLRGRADPPALAFCPERTIQGRALAELASLPQVIGGFDESSVARAGELFARVAADQVVMSSLEAAEMVKLVCNAHTDLIYGFGNEVALMADALAVPGNEVIAAANLRYPRPDLSRPGFVGGSCLVKDPYLLMHAAEEAGYRPPMVAAARAVNERIPRLVVDLVLKGLAGQGRLAADAKVLVCGIAYKGRPETDDVRGAASLQVAEALRGRVAVLAGHDFHVADGRIADAGFRPMGLAEGMDGADALVLLVDHPRYRQEIRVEAIRSLMRLPALVFDMWGELAVGLAGADDVEYLRLGRG